MNINAKLFTRIIQLKDLIHKLDNDPSSNRIYSLDAKIIQHANRC